MMNNNRRRNYRSRPQKNNFRRRNGSINSGNGSNYSNGNLNFNRNGSMTNPHNVEKTMLKFRQLAKDAQSSGDPVLVENYLQHADHYSRRLAELNEKTKINTDEKWTNMYVKYHQRILGGSRITTEVICQRVRQQLYKSMKQGVSHAIEIDYT